MVEKGIVSLQSGDFSTFGKLLDESWQLKKTLATGISDSGINQWYESAMKAGAYGGKLLGAGGGGFLMFIVPEDYQALSKLYQMPVSISRSGSRIIFTHES